jgi:hypothetical protein
MSDYLAPPKPLAMATLDTNSGPVTLPCEPVNEWLAIVPHVFMDEDGKTWLGGDFTVVHLPSQLEIVEGAGCIHCCRRAGRLLADAAVDWSTLTADNSRDWSTGLGEDTKMALAVARAVEWGCDAELCESDEEADDRG